MRGESGAQRATVSRAGRGSAAHRIDKRVHDDFADARHRLVALNCDAQTDV